MDPPNPQNGFQFNFALDTAARRLRRPNVDVESLNEVERDKILKRRKQKRDSSNRTKAKRAKISSNAPPPDQGRVDSEKLLLDGLISMHQEGTVDSPLSPLSLDVSMPYREPVSDSATHRTPPIPPSPSFPPHPVSPSRLLPTLLSPAPSRPASTLHLPPIPPPSSSITQPPPPVSLFPPPQPAPHSSGLELPLHPPSPLPPSSLSPMHVPPEAASVPPSPQPAPPQLIPPPRVPTSRPPSTQPFIEPSVALGSVDVLPLSPLTDLAPSPELPATSVQEDAPPMSLLATDAPPQLIDIFPEADVMFSKRSEYVTWCGKYRTRVPWVSCKTNVRQNELEHLATLIKRLASHVRDASESPFIFTLNQNDFANEQDIAQVVKAHMSKGESIIVKGYPLDRTTRLEQKNLQGLLGCDRSRVFDVHDTILRETKSFDKPHIKMTMAKFLRGLKSERCIQCILDCPSFGAESPRMCKHVDEGHTSWPKTFQKYGDYYFIPSDVPGSQEWFIIHQALYHTYVHHDAEGFGTWTRSLCGHKFWVLTRTRDNSQHADRKSLFQSLTSYHCLEDDKGKWDYGYQDLSDSYLVVLAPGDIIFQAPGTWHEVYTPNKSVTVGGHFYTYDSLHLTEASRLYDLMHPFIVTNQKHDSYHQTIVRMLIGITVRDHRKYFRKPLTALCRAVLCPYVHRPEDTSYLSAFSAALRETDFHENYSVPAHFALDSEDEPYVMKPYEIRALHVADAIVKNFSLDLSVAELTIVDGNYHLADGEDYLFSSSPWMEPGKCLVFSATFINELRELVLNE